MKFFSRFDRPRIDVKSHCPVMRNIYAYDPIKCDTVVVGSQNILEFISAPAPTCDIYYKINCYVNGDLNALGSGNAQGIYTDVVGMPSDINSINKLVRDVTSSVRSFGASDIPSFLELLQSKASENSQITNNNGSGDNNAE